MHKGILFKICRLYQDKTEDQHDLFQEMVLQLWISFDSFRGESQFSSWMYRVAFNTAIMYFKKEQRRRDVHEIKAYHDLPEELYPVERTEDQLAIFNQALQKLNKLEKALIFLYMEGRTGKEMAEILAISASNSRVRVNRIKDKLKYIIKTMGYEF
jgi:RNA polymerase sigma factor (sigma-70 family)